MPSALTWILFLQAFFIGGLTNLIKPTSTNSFGDEIQVQSIKESTNQKPDSRYNRFGYTYTPGIGFHKFHTTLVDWNTARLMCKEEGGHLAIINSAAEAELISQLWPKSIPPIVGPGDPDHAYVGFHDLFKKDQWVTVHDQSLEEAGFSEWDQGEPSNSYGNEHCGSIVRSGKLNDIDCSYLLFGFVCELPDKEPYLSEKLLTPKLVKKLK